MKITTPGDGKNVLTVGALDSLWTSKYETNRVYQLVTKSNQVFTLKRLIYGVDLFYLIKQNYIIENVQTTTYLNSASGKVLLPNKISVVLFLKTLQLKRLFLSVMNLIRINVEQLTIFHFLFFKQAKPFRYLKKRLPLKLLFRMMRLK